MCTLIVGFLYWLLVPPTITQAPQDTTVNESYPLKLTCKASGQPTPSITWIKDGQQLGKTVNILKSKRTDTGKYVCKADNSVKEAKTASAHVTVQCKFVSCTVALLLFNLPCYKVRILQIHSNTFCLLVVGKLYLFHTRATT